MVWALTPWCSIWPCFLGNTWDLYSFDYPSCYFEQVVIFWFPWHVSSTGRRALGTEDFAVISDLKFERTRWTILLLPYWISSVVDVMESQWAFSSDRSLVSRWNWWSLFPTSDSMKSMAKFILRWMDSRVPSEYWMAEKYGGKTISAQLLQCCSRFRRIYSDNRSWSPWGLGYSLSRCQNRSHHLQFILLGLIHISRSAEILRFHRLYQ